MNIREAINEGVRKGYREGFLRKSACDPLTRANTGDNTPAIVHFDIVPGDRLKISFMAKGGGSENMSRVTMLSPAQGWKGIREFVIGRVAEAGPNPCPPTIVGIGIGGTFEYAPILAKKALLRKLDDTHPDPAIAAMEEELLDGPEQAGHRPHGAGRQDHVPGGQDRHGPVPHRQPAPGREHPVPFRQARGGDHLMAEYRLTTPLKDEDIVRLRAGDVVKLTGTIYTARDAAHKRLVETLDKGEPLPFDLEGALIYYVGPVARASGAADRLGRPDHQLPHGHLCAAAAQPGLKGTIGKGKRSDAVKESLKAIQGGILRGHRRRRRAALLCIKEARVIAYEELGPEAIRELTVEDFPLLVINDSHGGEPLPVAYHHFLFQARNGSTVRGPRRSSDAA
jgi:tartrate/fumarate subfamily iron-sulfur-dependent hydro-lyase beta chain